MLQEYQKYYLWAKIVPIKSAISPLQKVQDPFCFISFIRQLLNKCLALKGHWKYMPFWLQFSKTIWARKFGTSLSQCDLPSFAGRFLMIIATNQHREQHRHKLSKKQVRFFVVILGFWQDVLRTASSLQQLKFHSTHVFSTNSCET